MILWEKIQENEGKKKRNMNDISYCVDKFSFVSPELKIIWIKDSALYDHEKVLKKHPGYFVRNGELRSSKSNLTVRNSSAVATI